MAAMWLFLCAFSAFVCGVFSQLEGISLPKVNISQGTVVGSVAAGSGYFEFYGIPYADSTSGTHRFKAPLPPPSFEDDFIANRKNIKCVRALGVGYEGTEDCLVVNVFTPTLNSTSRLPVMVWIKGKEFDTTNEPEISFQRFLENDVIIVNINYRESILGFLCLGTESAPGNAGLKDIIAGLKWIQNNIAAFGGDPDNVSIFGHGSGAAAVDLITLTPLAEGLVHKAIAQSGTALAPWAVTRNNLQYAIKVAEALGHKVKDLDTLSEVFSRTSVAALMAVINELDLTDNSLAFAPCIERSIENVEPLLLKSPYQTIIEGEQLKIPFMTGFVDVEGTIRTEKVINSDWLEKMEESFVDFIQPDIEFYSVDQEIEMTKEIKTFYFNGESINIESLSDFFTYQGDTMVLISAIREARMRTVSSNTSVFLYQFSYKGNLSESLEKPLSIDSAGHGEELVYLFNNKNNSDISTFDLVISEILIERWTNFAKNGVPTSETSQVEWQPYTFNNSNYLRVLDDEEIKDNENSVFEMELKNPHPETFNFWDTIYAVHFRDAKSRWNLNDRNEDVGDGETSSPSSPGGDGETSTSSPPGGGGETSSPSSPGGDGETSTSSPPGGGGETSSPSSPGGDGETSSPTTPGGGGETSSPTIPGGGGETSSPTTPGGGGETSSPTTPGEDVETSSITTPGGDGETSSPTTPGGGGETSSPTTPGGGGETSTPKPNSASTAVGYTFVIITLFAILDKFHSAQMLS